MGGGGGPKNAKFEYVRQVPNFLTKLREQQQSSTDAEASKRKSSALERVKEEDAEETKMKAEALMNYLDAHPDERGSEEITRYLDDELKQVVSSNVDPKLSETLNSHKFHALETFEDEGPPVGSKRSSSMREANSDVKTKKKKSIKGTRSGALSFNPEED
ncbi:hypothetical protein DIPPA_70049 [Diplonema papillatum]|nr:hypothetical protein DIPPA_70049 [Diplonema papillatum]